MTNSRSIAFGAVWALCSIAAAATELESMKVRRSTTSGDMPPPHLTALGINSQGFAEFRNEKDGSVLIEVPAGSFAMGSAAGVGKPEERPQHIVSLSTYCIGKYEVSNAQYAAFLAATADAAGPALHQGHHPDEGPDKDHAPNYPLNSPSYRRFSDGPSNPVLYVDWYDAFAYCAWAGLKLPSEAQWERAARGSDGRTYPWGEDASNAGGLVRANHYEGPDGYACTSPVGKFPLGASPVGALDMLGNVWEWVSDWYQIAYYTTQTSWVDPGGPSKGWANGLRGGSWGNFPTQLRVALRNGLIPEARMSAIGFRVCR